PGGVNRVATHAEHERAAADEVGGGDLHSQLIPCYRPMTPRGSPAAHENPRGRVAACRDGVEVGCRMVPLSPSLSGPRRCPAPRTVAYRPRYSTRRIFLAVSASPSCAESEEIDGGPLPRLLRPGRAPGQRDRLPALARRRPPAPPGG